MLTTSRRAASEVNVKTFFDLRVCVDDKVTFRKNLGYATNRAISQLRFISQ